MNPYELESVAVVLHRALQMPEDERQVRMGCLRTRERSNDVDHWMSSFMQATTTMIKEDGNI